MAKTPLAPSLGFPPLAAAGCRVLILGTLPGPRSLATHQYYAHPQNAFWPVMESLMGPLGSGYTERAQGLMARGIAVWDVLAAAPREGALDSRIDQKRCIPNDFAAFFLVHPDIGLICFNGDAASRLYRRFVVNALPEARQTMTTCILPSTSPARTLRFELKRAAWATALLPRLRDTRTATEPA